MYEVNDEEHGKKQGTGTASEGNVNNNQDQNSDNKTTPGAVNQSTPNKATLPNNVSKTLADQSTAGGNPTFSITVSPPEPLTSKELTCLKVTDDATGATKGIPCECPPILKFQAKPVKIDLLEAMETYEETFKLCRCGYSSNFPYCDNSHEKLDSWKEGVLPPPLSVRVCMCGWCTCSRLQYVSCILLVQMLH